MLDILIENGIVLNGSGHRRESSNVGIKGDRIVYVGPASPEAATRINAVDRLVAPGFIDMHTHTDFTLPVTPKAEAKLRQGVTTDVTGNCGFSPFPLGSTPQELSHGGFLEPRLRHRWPTLAEYAADLEVSGLGINVVPLVGLGAVRLSTVGANNEPAQAAEITAMKDTVRSCMSEGCFGASSGLVYAPSSFADQDELITMAQAVAEFGGIYATHMRNEGPGLLASIDSAIDIATRSGVSVQISHLKALGRRSWGSVEAALERIDVAVSDGLDIWFDVYPYTACSSTLASLLPASAFADGAAGLRRVSADPKRRDELLKHLEAGETIGLDGVRLAGVPGSPELSGIRLVELAEEQHTSASELCLSLLEAHGTDIVMVADAMAEADVKAALTHPRAIAGSDGWNLSADSVRYAHPRNFGATIRLIQTYVCERALLTIDEAIELLSVRPARRLGLADRGELKVSAIADIVVLDLNHIDQVSTLADPCKYPRGVTDVIVAGEVALADGSMTDARNGRVLSRRNGASPH